MNDAISLIINVLFYLIVAAFAFLSLLGIFIVIKYGRSHTVTMLTSLVYSALFLIFVLSAYFTLQQL